MKKFSFYLFLCLCNISLLQAQNGSAIYGLNFTNGQLKFASLDPNSGFVNLVSPNQLSRDVFAQGVADIDPIGKKYYYIRIGEIITVDIDSGTVLASPALSNPNNAVSPITNIAYNWLNDTIYGLNFTNGALRLASVDPSTGQVNVISSNAISPDRFSQGDADIDPVHRRYFYVRANGELVTVNLDNGQALNKVNIRFPAGSQNDFFLNLTYNWANDTLYGLYFKTGHFSTGTCQGALYLASVDITTGQLNVISQNPLSRDCFGQGVCDIDPVKGRYYYIRYDVNNGSELITANLSDGSLVSTITLTDPDPNGSVTPITNIAYNELYNQPNSRIGMNMGENIIMMPGQRMQLNAYVGPDATYRWQDGSTSHTMEVTTPGTYRVDIQRDAFQIRGEVTVTATDLAQDLLAGSLSVFPNPMREMLFVKWESEENKDLTYELRNALGQAVATGKLLDEARISTADLAQGSYVLRVTDGNRSQYKMVIKR